MQTSGRNLTPGRRRDALKWSGAGGLTSQSNSSLPADIAGAVVTAVPTASGTASSSSVLLLGSDDEDGTHPNPPSSSGNGSAASGSGFGGGGGATLAKSSSTVEQQGILGGPIIPTGCTSPLMLQPIGCNTSTATFSARAGVGDDTAEDKSSKANNNLFYAKFDTKKEYGYDVNDPTRSPPVPEGRTYKKSWADIEPRQRKERVRHYAEYMLVKGGKMAPIPKTETSEKKKEQWRKASKKKREKQKAQKSGPPPQKSSNAKARTKKSNRVSDPKLKCQACGQQCYSASGLTQHQNRLGCRRAILPSKTTRRPTTTASSSAAPALPANDAASSVSDNSHFDHDLAAAAALVSLAVVPTTGSSSSSSSSSIAEGDATTRAGDATDAASAAAAARGGGGGGHHGHDDEANEQESPTIGGGDDDDDRTLQLAVWDTSTDVAPPPVDSGAAVNPRDRVSKAASPEKCSSVLLLASDGIRAQTEECKDYSVTLDDEADGSDRLGFDADNEGATLAAGDTGASKTASTEDDNRNVHSVTATCNDDEEHLAPFVESRALRSTGDVLQHMDENESRSGSLVNASSVLQWLCHNPAQAPEIIVKAKECWSQEASGDGNLGSDRGLGSGAGSGTDVGIGPVSSIGGVNGTDLGGLATLFPPIRPPRISSRVPLRSSESTLTPENESIADLMAGGYEDCKRRMDKGLDSESKSTTPGATNAGRSNTSSSAGALLEVDNDDWKEDERCEMPRPEFTGSAPPLSCQSSLSRNGGEDLDHRSGALQLQPMETDQNEGRDGAELDETTDTPPTAKDNKNLEEMGTINASASAIGLEVSMDSAKRGSDAGSLAKCSDGLLLASDAQFHTTQPHRTSHCDISADPVITPVKPSKPQLDSATPRKMLTPKSSPIVKTSENKNNVSRDGSTGPEQLIPPTNEGDATIPERAPSSKVPGGVDANHCSIVLTSCNDKIDGSLDPSIAFANRTNSETPSSIVGTGASSSPPSSNSSTTVIIAEPGNLYDAGKSSAIVHQSPSSEMSETSTDSVASSTIVKCAPSFLQGLKRSDTTEHVKFLTNIKGLVMLEKLLERIQAEYEESNKTLLGELKSIEAMLQGCFYAKFEAIISDIKQIIIENPCRGTKNRKDNYVSSVMNMVGEICSEFCSPSSCFMCGLGSRKRPVPDIFYCDGEDCCLPNSQIRKGKSFYHYDDDEGGVYDLCTSCYRNLGDQAEFLLSSSGKTIYKADLTKTNAIELSVEAAANCVHCKRRFHEACGLALIDVENRGRKDSICPECFLSKNIEPSEDFSVDALPTTNESNYIEKAVNQFMGDSAKAIRIREVSSIEEISDVDDNICTAFSTLPSEFKYRSRCFIAIQNIHGSDVILFVFFVHEHGVDSLPQNNGIIYVAYLDSVRYIVAPEGIRPGQVYQEILAAYLDWARGRGFTKCLLWSCAPEEGDDYILPGKPPEQRRKKWTEANNALLKMYLELGRTCEERGICSKITTFMETYLVSAKSIRDVPLMVGDILGLELSEMFGGDDADADADDANDYSNFSEREILRDVAKRLVSKEEAENMLVYHLNSKAGTVKKTTETYIYEEDDDGIFRDRYSYRDFCDSMNYRCDSLRLAKLSSLGSLRSLFKGRKVSG